MTLMDNINSRKNNMVNNISNALWNIDIFLQCLKTPCGAFYNANVVELRRYRSMKISKLNSLLGVLNRCSQRKIFKVCLAILQHQQVALMNFMLFCNILKISKISFWTFWKRNWLFLPSWALIIVMSYKDVYVNSFFPRTARLWKFLSSECFPLTNDLNGCKSRINRHLLSACSF